MKNLLNKQMTFGELDTEMQGKGFFSEQERIYNDNVLKEIIDDGKIYYTKPEPEDEADTKQFEVKFEVTIDAGNDEILSATYIRIIGIKEV